MAILARSRCAFLLGIACWCLHPAALGASPWFNSGILAGDAAGLDDGYLHLGGFVPLAQPNGRSLLFADVSVQSYNESSDSFGGNLGLGGRFFSPEFNRVFGGYVYYDRRDLDAWAVDQVAFGLESLGDVWDARLNVNLPLGGAYDVQLTDSTPRFVGSNLVVTGIESHALSVVEAEVGRVLAEWDTSRLKGFVGMYGLFDGPDGDTAGVRARLGARINDRLWLGAHVEHDDVFDTSGGFTAEWRFGRTPRPSRFDLLARLDDPVFRRRHVAVSESANGDVVLTSGGAPITVTHVDDDAPLDATAVEGTFENPHDVLDNASGVTSNIVYVHGGVYDGQALVVTQANQQVFSAGRDAGISADQGRFVIGSTSTARITNSPSDAFFIDASNVTVSGFEIAGAVRGFNLRGGADNVWIVGNTITSTGSRGINSIAASGVIEENTITGAGSHGMIFFGSFTGSFTSNTVTGSALNGFQILGGVTGEFTGNIANNNGGNGVLLGGLDTAYTNNTTNNNGSDGVWISGDVGGGVFNNTANNNSFNGITVSGTISGATTPNTTTGNGGVDFQN